MLIIIYECFAVPMMIVFDWVNIELMVVDVNKPSVLIIVQMIIEVYFIIEIGKKFLPLNYF